jgi:RNA ligase (TIGR02306 family)
MRQLVSIQTIKALESIDGADAIEKATVLGWQLVVKKGEFQVGDLAVYCEIDSLMPDIPIFEFLKPRGMRIKTIRLRGQISQGICFPLSILPDDCPKIEGQDVTEILGITKYEPAIPACLSGIAKGGRPSFIPKTDETRVQVLQKVLDFYENELCYVTEKLDGSSATYYIKDENFGACSRSLDLIEDDENSFWKVARQMDIESKMRSIGRNIALQGELFGEGIQGNKLKQRGQTVRFFNAFDIDNYCFLSFEAFEQLLIDLDLPIVPILERNYLLENDIEKIVTKATIKSSLCPTAWAEGIVIRPHIQKSYVNISNEHFVHGRISFKAINPEFLLKYGE